MGSVLQINFFGRQKTCKRRLKETSFSSNTLIHRQRFLGVMGTNSKGPVSVRSILLLLMGFRKTL